MADSGQGGYRQYLVSARSELNCGNKVALKQLSSLLQILPFDPSWFIPALCVLPQGFLTENNGAVLEARHQTRFQMKTHRPPEWQPTSLASGLITDGSIHMMLPGRSGSGYIGDILDPEQLLLLMRTEHPVMPGVVTSYCYDGLEGYIVDD